MKYRFVGDHAEDLDDGRMLEPAQFVDLDDLDGRAQVLLSEGKLVAVGEAPDATDDAVSLAKENDVELTMVTGTGEGGRIVVKDVRKFITDREGSQG